MNRRCGAVHAAARGLNMLSNQLEQDITRSEQISAGTFDTKEENDGDEIMEVCRVRGHKSSAVTPDSRSETEQTQTRQRKIELRGLISINFNH